MSFQPHHDEHFQVSFSAILEDLSEMVEVAQLTKMGLNQDSTSQLSQSHHSKCHLNQWLELREGGGGVLQKEIP